MLVLSRKPGEKIILDGGIVITIVRIGPNTVRIGIEAPQNVSIARAEIADARADRNPIDRTESD